VRVMADAGLVVGQQGDHTEIGDRVEKAVEIASAEGSGASTDRFGDIEAAYCGAGRLFNEAEIAGRGGWESEGRADAEVEVVGQWGGHGGRV